jgi:hypothetical protein
MAAFAFNMQKVARPEEYRHATKSRAASCHIPQPKNMYYIALRQADAELISSLNLL